MFSSEVVKFPLHYLLNSSKYIIRYAYEKYPFLVSYIKIKLPEFFSCHEFIIYFNNKLNNAEIYFTQ